MEKEHMVTIIEDILDEVKRAETKHPEWPSDIIHASAIVGEESGELTRACLQFIYEGGSKLEARKEAIQVACTAIRFLKALDELHYIPSKSF